MTIRVSDSLSNALALAEATGELQFMRARFGPELDGEAKTVLTLTDVTWSGLAALRRAGAELEVTILPEDAKAEHALDSALESWSVEEAGLPDKGGIIFVRAISTSRHELDGFIRRTGSRGWAYLGVRQGEQRMAVLFETTEVSSALSLCAELESGDLGITELSVLSQHPIVEDVLHDALLSQKEIHV